MTYLCDRSLQQGFIELVVHLLMQHACGALAHGLIDNVETTHGWHVGMGLRTLRWPSCSIHRCKERPLHSPAVFICTHIPGNRGRCMARKLCSDLFHIHMATHTHTQQTGSQLGHIT